MEINILLIILISAACTGLVNYLPNTPNFNNKKSPVRILFTILLVFLFILTSYSKYDAEIKIASINNELKDTRESLSISRNNTEKLLVELSNANKNITSLSIQLAEARNETQQAREEARFYMEEFEKTLASIPDKTYRRQIQGDVLRRIHKEYEKNNPQNKHLGIPSYMKK